MIFFESLSIFGESTEYLCYHLQLYFNPINYPNYL
jgi:hypothetical protein